MATDTKIFAAEPSPGAPEPPTAKIDRFLVEGSRLRAFPRQEIFRGSGAPLGLGLDAIELRPKLAISPGSFRLAVAAATAKGAEPLAGIPVPARGLAQDLPNDSRPRGRLDGRRAAPGGSATVLVVNLLQDVDEPVNRWEIDDGSVFRVSHMRGLLLRPTAAD